MQLKLEGQTALKKTNPQLGSTSYLTGRTHINFTPNTIKNSTSFNIEKRRSRSHYVQNINTLRKMEASLIDNHHLKDKYTDRLYQPLRQTFLEDNSVSQKMNLFSEATRHSHWSKIAHPHNLEQNKRLAQKTLIPETVKLRQVKNLDEISLPDRDRYYIVNVNQKKGQPISQEEARSRINERKKLRGDLSTKPSRQLSEQEQIIFYEYGSSYSNSRSSLNEQANLRNDPFGSKMVQSRFQTCIQEQKKRQQTSFRKTQDDSQEKKKSDLKNTQIQERLSSFYAHDSSKNNLQNVINANLPNSLFLTNNYTSNTIQSAIQKAPQIGPIQITCNPDYEKLRKQTSELKGQNQDKSLNNQYMQAQTQDKNQVEIIKLKSNKQVRKYQGFISKYQKSQNQLIQNQKKAQKYNLFSFIDRPINYFIQNLCGNTNKSNQKTQKVYSNKSNDLQDRSKNKDKNLKKQQNSSSCFCPQNQCVARKHEKQINWVIPQRQLIKSSRKSRNISNLERDTIIQE